MHISIGIKQAYLADRQIQLQDSAVSHIMHDKVLMKVAFGSPDPCLISPSQNNII